MERTPNKGKDAHQFTYKGGVTLKGETHRSGGKFVQNALRVPICMTYMIIKPSAPEVLTLYLFYNSITDKAIELGSVLPDYDQNTYQQSPKVLPHTVGVLYHNFLRKIAGATHRSTHTHNLDLNMLILGIPAFALLGMFKITKRGYWFVLFLWLFALLLGILSHQYLDTLTIAGTNQSHIMASIRKVKNNKANFKKKQDRAKTRIVSRNRIMWGMKPLMIGKFKTPFARPVRVRFPETDWQRTGGGWEDFINNSMVSSIDKMNTIPRRIVELIVLYFIFQAI